MHVARKNQASGIFSKNPRALKISENPNPLQKKSRKRNLRALKKF